MNDDMGQDFGGLTPEEIQALLATSGDPSALADLQDQRKMADKLRAGAFQSHPGQMIGNQYIPDISGALLGGLGALKANMMDKKTDAAQKDLFAKQQAASASFLKALTDRRPPGTPYGTNSNPYPQRRLPTDLEQY